MTGFPLTNFDHVKDLLEDSNENPDSIIIPESGNLIEGPVLFVGEFNVDGDILDTYCDLTGWGKVILDPKKLH